jgi:hypothetical protein
MKKRMIASAFLVLIGLMTQSASKARANVLPGPREHNILSTELPAALRADIKKDYPNYWITGLYEEARSKKISYFITLENADQVIAMSSDDSENWVVTGTTIKDN